MMKLGKLAPRIDKRTLRLETVLVPSNLPPLLPEYDIDRTLKLTDNRVFLNDRYGDCVVAGSGHAILRWEKFECGRKPTITDAAVKKQYFKETGGPDEGLVLLDHLNIWRKDGLRFGKTYKIDAFASVDWRNHTQVMYAIQLLGGVYLGMQVPAYFMDGFTAGQRFFDVQSKNARIEGGHCIYSPAFIKIAGYNSTGPVIVTWGERVQLTWAFWDRFVDECFIVLDALNAWTNPATDPLNIQLLRNYIRAICQQDGTACR